MVPQQSTNNCVFHAVCYLAFFLPHSDATYVTRAFCDRLRMKLINELTELRARHEGQHSWTHTSLNSGDMLIIAVISGYLLAQLAQSSLLMMSQVFTPVLLRVLEVLSILQLFHFEARQRHMGHKRNNMSTQTYVECCIRGHLSCIDSRNTVIS